MRRLLCLALCLSACTHQQVPTAELILKNGKFHTVDPAKPFATAVAIDNQCYVYVGDDDGVEQYVGPGTELIDLNGAMAMPGINEAHAHPILGGVETLQCLFAPSASPDEIKQTLTDCVENRPNAEWIEGGRWSSGLFEQHDLGNPRLWLDEISTKHAISLADDTGHNRWANSKALQLAELNQDSVIYGGELGIRDGELNGLLYEAAIQPLLRVIPQPGIDKLAQAGLASIKTANSFGITGTMEAGDAQEGVAAYKVLADSGRLTAHLGVAITVPLLADGQTLDADLLVKLRQENRGENTYPDFAKLFLDGVPTTARTAAMIDRYQPQPGDYGPIYGDLLVTPETVTALLTQLDALGFTTLVHAAGDRSVRVVLDAVEITREINGNSGLRHQLAHGGFIHPEDIPRLAELNVTADFSPYLWYPSLIAQNFFAALGPRATRYWPTRELLDAGAEVVVGSDYPAVLPTMNPWIGLESLVTRADPYGRIPGTLWPEQAVSLKEAIHIFTLAGAKALRLDDQTGSISVGKYADLIVLNHDLFAIEHEQISLTEVVTTYFKGDVVYQAQE